jgi:hypothetical protein
MRCPSCECENPEGAKFCIECASPLKNRCPSCGFENLARAKEVGLRLGVEICTDITALQ